MMKGTLATYATMILAMCLIMTAGCTGSVSGGENTTGPTASAVSINDTPIRYAEVNGVNLAYREFGAGDPLLMIIGFGSVMEGWNETFIDILADKYHVYIYDHRAMGHSGDNDAPYTIEQLADDAAGLMDALGYESMNVYGVSMGSSVSQQLVIAHPEHVRKLVLSSATYSARLNETQLLYSILAGVAADPSQPEGLRKEAEANLAWDGTYDELSGITNDVMLITGTADVLTPESVAVRIAGEIDGSWLVRFKGIPHAGSSSAPEEYGRIVLTFLGMDESPA
ncbi:alpha/beta fold hydrolase [Methanofollis liminatans]|nr:alpha/beta hydrolase [Methanofollis liminatans]